MKSYYSKVPPQTSFPLNISNTLAKKGHDILYYFKRHIGERNLFASFMNFRLKPAEFSNNASYFSIRHDYIAVILIFTVWAVCVCME